MTIHPTTRFHLRKKMSATNFTDLIMGAYALGEPRQQAQARRSPRRELPPRCPAEFKLPAS